MKIQCVTSAAAMALTISTPAVIQAHSGATGVVKERMEAMKEMGKSIKAIAQMVTGKSPFVADGVKAGARLIAGHAGEKITMLFPEGSNQHPSEASAEIWTDWKRFSELAIDLETTASGLIDAADQGQESSRAAFGKVAASCKACHSDFRISK